jgi:2-methylcitrate dehydratase
LDAIWKELILTPHDYSAEALGDAATKELMGKIEFKHGGESYDRAYPDGIPTSLNISTSENKSFETGLVMYPAGHARNTAADLKGILLNKFKVLGALGVSDVTSLLSRFDRFQLKSADQIANLYDFEIVPGNPVD